jgi:hypothetical protein
MQLIQLERGDIVLYNGIHITVDLEVLRFGGAKKKGNCTDQGDVRVYVSCFYNQPIH